MTFVLSVEEDGPAYMAGLRPGQRTFSPSIRLKGRWFDAYLTWPVVLLVMLRAFALSVKAKLAPFPF